MEIKGTDLFAQKAINKSVPFVWNEWQAGVPSAKWCYIPLSSPGALDSKRHIRRFSEGELLDYTITDPELKAAGLWRACWALMSGTSTAASSICCPA